MNSQTIVMCVIALILGMLLANMLKSVCGCKVVEGQRGLCPPGMNAKTYQEYAPTDCANCLASNLSKGWETAYSICGPK